MSLLPQTASFEELVQDCFLTHRGAGLMLSPLDVELVMAWAELEVPFEVVARGIRKAAEKAVWDARPGEAALRTLRACRREVEQEIKKYQARAVGAHAEAEAEKRPARTFEEERHRKLRAAVAKLGREEEGMREATGALIEGVLASPAKDVRGADRQEDLVVALLFRARPWEVRRALYKEAAVQRGDEVLSTAQARRLSARFHRQVVLRRALSLPAFW